MLGVHGRVERTPVVPPLGFGRPRRVPVGADAAGRGGTSVGAPVVDRPRHGVPQGVHRGLVGVDARLVPLQPQVVVDARVVRLGRRLDERRCHVSVEVEHVRGQPLLDDRDGRVRLGLRLRHEVAVEVEAVAVGPGSGHPSVRVLDDVEEQDAVVEHRVDLVVRPVGGGGQLLERLEDRLDPLVLVAVDRALDVDRYLDVVPERLQQLLSPPGVGERDPAHLLPGLEVLPLLHGVQGVDRHEEEVAVECRLPDDLQGHPAVARRRRCPRACTGWRSRGCAGSYRPGRRGRCRPAGSRRHPPSGCRTRAARRPHCRRVRQRAATPSSLPPRSGSSSGGPSWHDPPRGR